MGELARLICVGCLAAALGFGSSSCSSGGNRGKPGLPAAPTGMTATPGCTEVFLGWNAVAGATSYNLYWSTTSPVTKTTGTPIPGVTSPYTHAGLSSGTTYYYVATTLNVRGESAESSQVFATVTPGPGALGFLDTTFGGPGWVVHDSAAGGNRNDRGFAIALDSSGRILAGGFSTNVADDTDMVIWRYE